MARLSDDEKRQILEGAERMKDELRRGMLPDRNETLYFKPDPASRMRYIRFATAARCFFRGEKPVRFKGDNWRL